MEQGKERLEQLESLVMELLSVKEKNIPEQLLELIPAHFTPEERLVWLEKLQRKGVLPKTSLLLDSPDFVSGETNYVTELSEDDPDYMEDRTQLLEQMLADIVETRMDKIPEAIVDMIPEDFGLAEKLRWLLKIEEKGLLGQTVPLGKLGTGPNTGPGTAPGTGPGTMPAKPDAKKKEDAPEYLES